MAQLRFVVSVLVAAFFGAMAGGSPALAQARFPTPEDTVTAYIDGLARQDFRAILAATAVNEMAKGYDFVGTVDWLRSLGPTMAAPSGTPYLVELNRANFTAQIAYHLKMLLFGLTTTSALVENKTVLMTGEEAAAFAAAADPARLSGIALVKIGVPKPDTLNSERNQFNYARNARLHGADEATDRVALITFEGGTFMVGLTLLRYGEEWKIFRPTSVIAGLDPVGLPMPTTPEAFELVLE